MKLIILSLLLFANSSIFAQSAQPFRQGNYWGYKNAEGQILVAARYDTAYTFEHQKAKVAYDNFSNSKRQFGLIDVNGKEILPCNYDSIWVYPNGCAMATDAKNPKGILYDTNGKEIWKSADNAAQLWPPYLPLDKMQKGLIPVLSFWTYFDNNTDTLAPNWGYRVLFGLDSSQNYFLAMTKQLTWQVVDTAGQPVSNLEFDECYPVYGGQRKTFDTQAANFILKKADTCYAIDEKGAVFWQGESDSLRIFSPAVALIHRKGKKFFLNYRQKTAKIVDFNLISYDGNSQLFKVQKGQKYGFCDLSGDLVVPIEYAAVGGVKVNVGNADLLIYNDSISQFQAAHCYVQKADSQYIINVKTKEKIAFSAQQSYYCNSYQWVIIYTENKDKTSTTAQPLPLREFIIYKGTKFVAKVKHRTGLSGTDICPNYILFSEKNQLTVYNKRGKNFIFNQFSTNASESAYSLDLVREAAEINGELYFLVSNNYASSLWGLKYGLIKTFHKEQEVQFIGQNILCGDDNDNTWSWYQLNGAKLKQLATAAKSNLGQARIISDECSTKKYIFAQYQGYEYKPTCIIFDENGKQVLKLANLDRFKFNNHTEVKIYNQNIFYLEQTYVEDIDWDKVEFSDLNKKFRHIFNRKGEQLSAGTYQYHYQPKIEQNRKRLTFDGGKNKIGMLDLELGTVLIPAKFDEILYKAQPENVYIAVERINNWEEYETVIDQEGKIICRHLYQKKPYNLTPVYLRSRYNCQRISPYIYDYELAKNGVIYTIPKLSYLNEKGECVENCDLLAPQN